MKLKLFIFTTGAAIVLSGCSTTADYSESVLRLETAINDSVTSIEAIDSDITARQNNKLKKDVIAKNLLLGAANGQCTAGNNKCSLIVLKKKEDDSVLVVLKKKEDDSVLVQVSAYPLKSSMPKGIKALEQVKLYVSRLKSIVDADTADKVTASANATLGSLEEIINQSKDGAQDNGKDNKITAYKEPVMGLIEWITNRYVERVKKEALAKATLQAHPVIQDLTDLYATEARAQKLGNISRYRAAFTKKQKYIDNNPATSSSIDAYVTAAKNYEVALKALTANPLESFKFAHDKLKKQLNGEGETTLVDVAAALERLEQEATKIKELVESFKKTNDTNNGD